MPEGGRLAGRPVRPREAGSPLPCKALFTKLSRLMISQKVTETMVSFVGARCFAPETGHAQRAPTIRGTLSVRCSDEVEAQSRSERDPALGGRLFTKPLGFISDPFTVLHR